MSIKKKDSVRKPPLSALDKMIYRILFVLGVCAGLFLWIFLGIWIPEKIGCSAEGVIACTDQSGLLTSVPIAFCVGVGLIIVSVKGLEQKQPIFGNKKVENSWRYPVAVYPLISKAFWEKMSDKTKKYIKAQAGIFLVLLAVCASILFLGWYPRSVLYEDGRIESYGVTNQLDGSAHIDEANSLDIEIHRSSSGRKRHKRRYVLYFRFSFEKASYSFTLGDFANMSRKETLLYMQDLKSRFGGRVRLIGEEYLDAMIKKIYFSPEEQELLYALFDLR